MSLSTARSSPPLPYGLWRGREGALDITSAQNSKVKLMRCVSHRMNSWTQICVVYCMHMISPRSVSRLRLISVSRPLDVPTTSCYVNEVALGLRCTRVNLFSSTLVCMKSTGSVRSRRHMQTRQAGVSRSGRVFLRGGEFATLLFPSQSNMISPNNPYLFRGGARTTNIGIRNTSALGQVGPGHCMSCCSEVRCTGTVPCEGFVEATLLSS